MKPLLQECARTLSQRERVAAEQPGEGLPTPQVIHASRVCACSPKIETPHPPPPAAPSPSGRGWARSFVARKRYPWCARASDVRGATNFLDHPIQPFLHLIVREAKLDKPVALDERAARGVAFKLFRMMLAVELDGEPESVTAKICDEASDRYLSSEFQPVEPAAAKLLPQHVLGSRAIGSQAARNICRSFGHHPQLGRQRARSQPLTRRLRRHPLPPGKGLSRSL